MTIPSTTPTPTVRWLISPRDPIVFRDGRPFSADPGSRARTLNFLPPSAVAGTCRTRLGSDSEGRFDEALIPNLLETALFGPFLWADGSFLLPRPQDAVAIGVAGPDQPSDSFRFIALRPQELGPGEGVDLPPGLSLLSPVSPLPEGKTAEGVPAWWKWSRVADWLWGRPTGWEGPALSAAELGKPGPTPESRIHVGIHSQTGTSEEGRLFGTEGLRFDAGPGNQYSIWVGLHPGPKLAERAASLPDGLHPLGGEGRLAWWRASTERPPALPEGANVNVVEGQARIRLMLATPVPLRDGWKPGWLNQNGDGAAFVGCPPALVSDGAPLLRLRAAAVPRYQSLSGWSLSKNDPRTNLGKPGPKPVRRLVPAGSVFFFDFPADNASPLDVARTLWLSSMADDKADRLDGYGIILVGTW